MSFPEILFYVLALLTVACAVCVVAMRHPIHSAFALIATLFFLAGVFVLLEAHFVAIIQVMVYAGAVMVLFMFVIMLLNLAPEELGPAKVTASKLLGLMLLAFSAYAAVRAYLTSEAPAAASTGRVVEGTVEEVGKLLFTKYLFPFEIVSVLLLAAILGAVVLAKKRW